MGINESDPIIDHFDGFGLNDALEITRDERDPDAGGCSHSYTLILRVGDAPGFAVGTIEFQHGARNLPDSTPGPRQLGPLGPQASVRAR